MPESILTFLKFHGIINKNNYIGGLMMKSCVCRENLLINISKRLADSPSMLATLESGIKIAKQICVHEGKVLIWLVDHIYTVRNEEFVSAVEECMMEVDKPDDKFILKMDVEDKETAKLMRSLK